jgi:hypothetical protein
MNTRRLIFLSIIFFLILILVGVMVYKKRMLSQDPVMQFAISDTASLTRIFLADKNGNQSTLDKVSPGHWTVNGKYDVQPSKMQTLMDAVYRVRVKSPVPKQYREDVIRILATSIKVMLYKGDKLEKVYYVGSETPDALGTYMCIENADDPMITEIPGFNGFLTPRFMTKESDWKTNTIVSVAPEKIVEATVSYDRHPEISYRIIRSNGRYQVSSLDPRVSTVYTNEKRISEYLALFANLSMEGYDPHATNVLRDSIVNTAPLATLTIKDDAGNEDIVKVFVKILPPGREVLDPETGQYSNIDPNRYYAFTNKDPKIMIVQGYNFGRVLQRFDFFR